MSDDAAANAEVVENKRRAKKAKALELLNYNVARICAEEEEAGDLRISRKCATVLCDIVQDYAKSIAVDMEMFAKHAKRQTVTEADLILCARKNPALHSKLEAFVERLGSEVKPPPRKKKK